MKFPSLSSLVEKALGTFFRFPVALVLAVVATVFAMRVVHLPHNSDTDAYHWYFNMIGSCYLGMLLSIAVTIPVGKMQPQRTVVVGTQGFVLTLTLLFYLSLPDHTTRRVVIRYILFALGLHWLIAFIGFTARDEMNKFWQFNKRLFLRILTSFLYTLVLYAGLALALLAIDQLFRVDVGDKVYQDLWWALAGIFNTWLFLAGLPDTTLPGPTSGEFSDQGVLSDYPRGLKIFTQYVLLPILTIYLVILYAYVGKIVVTAHWPSGWVAYLVLGFAVAGILSLLLIHPLRNEVNNKWIGAYARFFYIALLPLILLLFAAIWKRVAIYGITELRYFVLLLAFWLLAASLYFLVSKKKDIRLIPASLFLLAFLSAFGPWGAFQVSMRSQRGQLKTILVKDRLFSEGKGIPTVAKPPLNDRKRITELTEYLTETHGYRVFQPWFQTNLDSLMHHDAISGLGYTKEQTDALLKLMNLKYTDRWVSDNDEESAYFRHERWREDLVLSVTGTDFLLPEISIDKDQPHNESYFTGRDSLVINLDEMGTNVTPTHWKTGGPAQKGRLDFDLTPLLTTMPKGTNDRYTPLSSTIMTIKAVSDGWNGSLFITEINGLQTSHSVDVRVIRGYLAFSRR